MIRKQKPSEEIAVTEEREAAQRCGKSCDSIRAVCMLPEGHVKTRDDWHESTAEETRHTVTNSFEMTTTTHEQFRWAPHLFELPDEFRRALSPKEPA
jgi:hypothetical protein